MFIGNDLDAFVYRQVDVISLRWAVERLVDGIIQRSQTKTSTQVIIIGRLKTGCWVGRTHIVSNQASQRRIPIMTQIATSPPNFGCLCQDDAVAIKDTSTNWSIINEAMPLVMYIRCHLLCHDYLPVDKANAQRQKEHDKHLGQSAYICTNIHK